MGGIFAQRRKFWSNPQHFSFEINFAGGQSKTWPFSKLWGKIEKRNALCLHYWASGIKRNINVLCLNYLEVPLFRSSFHDIKQFPDNLLHGASARCLPFSIYTALLNWSEHTALVAQWIRHRPPKPGIAGSSPAGGLKIFFFRRLIGYFDLYYRCISWS